jgi:C4-dicarboxylate transporter DctQ subunit
MSSFISKLCSLQDAITKVAATLAAIGLGSIVIAYVYEVITRYFFNSPTAWVSDYVSYALAASVFLALPKVTQDKQHVAVTILVDIMPSKWADIIYTIISLIGFLCLSFAAYVSALESWRQYSKGIETLAIIPIPQWWVSIFITFGLLLSSLYLLRQANPSHRVNSNLLMEN